MNTEVRKGEGNRLPRTSKTIGLGIMRKEVSIHAAKLGKLEPADIRTFKDNVERQRPDGWKLGSIQRK